MTLSWDGFPLAVAKMGCTSPEGKNLWGLKREGLVTSLVSKKRQIGQNPRTTKKQALPKLCKAAKSKFLFHMSQPVKPLSVLFRRNTLIFSATPTHGCWLNWGELVLSLSSRRWIPLFHWCLPCVSQLVWEQRLASCGVRGWWWYLHQLCKRLERPPAWQGWERATVSGTVSGKAGLIFLCPWSLCSLLHFLSPFF